ncbi:hypothetical protein Y032_0099g3162 [Ancylostoma ceylanicum]|uniref:Uncharacterized protein n=1 Tax=Ancylostoma ceylanicum TaxID=53326 RepID=A0A016TIJ2_9BILA|nr:hypothetical protein Y032_0099g3162 [Ancylostoma ceylanicum]
MERQSQLCLPRTGAPQHLRGAGEATLNIHYAEPRCVGSAARQSSGDAILIDVLCRYSVLIACLSDQHVS